MDIDIFAGPKPTDQPIQAKNNEDQFAVLNAILKKLQGYYTHTEVEEIVINRPGEIWLRRRRPKEGEKIWNQLADSTLTFDYLERVAKIVANVNSQKFGRGEGKMPAVYAALPGGHRFTACLYNNVVYDEQTPTGGVVMAIRQAPREDNVIEYDAYGLTAGMRVEKARKFKEQRDDSKDDLQKLKNAINRGSHLIVSGATSTGKTTLLNRIITELDPELRVATVEDTRELVVPHKNRFHLVLSRTANVNDFDDAAAINLLTRMTPDVILCGEVSTENANTIWELTGSGHGSMMTTLHAEDPEEALKTFIKRMAHQKPGLNEPKLLEEMKERFTVIQIVRDHDTGRRRITAIETFV